MNIYKRLLRSHGSEPRKIVTDKLLYQIYSIWVGTWFGLNTIEIWGVRLQNGKWRLPDCHQLNFRHFRYLTCQNPLNLSAHHPDS